MNEIEQINQVSMRVVLVLGAGRSSAVLISYLLKEAEANEFEVVVGDLSEQAAQERVGKSPFGKALRFDITDERTSRLAIAGATVVISLLPAHLHTTVARYCIELEKHLITASYVSPEMQACHEEAKNKNLLFLNECGLDPGIDHMSAMHVIDRIKEEDSKIISFESFTGGLIAPETDRGNPWRYKFTWNPRNVVVAGQGAAKFLQDGMYKYIPYQQLFTRTWPVHIRGYGDYEGYANRDSLKYIETYGLHGIETMLRGTLRNRGYCKAWNVFVQLGCCDDTYLMEGVGQMTHADFIASFTGADRAASINETLARELRLDLDGPEMQKLRWSGLFDNERIGLDNGTPAQLLEHILNKNWKLSPNDKDLIIMWHRFVYEVNGVKKEIQASMVIKGDDAVNTAMAKTVGLPLGIAAKYLMDGSIKQRGVKIPVEKEIYKPILNALKILGIDLVEEHF